MNVAFRVDASPEMGLGHLGRCLALAHALRSLGATPLFITRNLGIDSAAPIEGQGFAVRRLAAPPPLPAPAAAAPPHASWAGVDAARDADETRAIIDTWSADWLVIDHYAFDRRWHDRMADARTRLCVIDDLADRDVRAELLVDHNPAADHRAKFAGHIDGVHTLLGGPRFALLGPAYADADPYRFRTEVGSIGIFMGGTDGAGLSTVALRACREVARFEGAIEVVTTSANPRLDVLRRECAQGPRTELRVDLPDLAAFFQRHDLQIGAGGGAAWERCCIGVPTLAVMGASNQAVVLEALSARGAARTIESPSLDGVGKAVAELLHDSDARHSLAAAARGWVDGRGAERVALVMCVELLALRPATSADAERAHAWRNDERTRRHFRDPKPVRLQDHRQWWDAALHDRSRQLLIAGCGDHAVGTVRLDFHGDEAEVSFYLDPALTGLGLGKAMLTAAQRWIAQQNPATRLVAEVGPGNEASHGAFRAAGFARAGSQRWHWEMRP